MLLGRLPNHSAVHNFVFTHPSKPHCTFLYTLQAFYSQAPAMRSAGQAAPL